MSGVIYKGKLKKVFVSANNYYGSDLKADILDDDIGEFLAYNVPMTELVEPVNEFATTIVSNTTAGIKVTTLTSLGDLIKSDRIKIVNEIYRVIDIDVTTKNVTLHRPLTTPLTAGDIVTKVGNMGTFKINLLLTKNGYFVLQAKDSKFGIQRSIGITVKETSLEDLIELTNTEINENERIIRDSSRMYTIIA